LVDTLESIRDALPDPARSGIRRLTDLQRQALGDLWPFA